MRHIIFTALLILTSLCSCRSGNENGIVFQGKGKIWIGKTSVDLSSLDTNDETWDTVVRCDPITSQVWAITKENNDTDKMYIYNITDGKINQKDFITIKSTGLIKFFPEICGDKVLIIYNDIKTYEIYDLTNNERTDLDLTDIIESFHDGYISFMGFNGEQLFFYLSDCLRRVHTPPLWGVINGVDPETDTLPKQPYPVRSAAGLVDYSNPNRHIVCYTIKNNDFSIIPFNANLSRIRYIPNENKIVGINDNHSIVIFDIDTNEYTDTGIYRKKFFPGQLNGSEYYLFLDGQYLYFSQYTFNIFVETIRLLYLHNGVELHNWYQYNLKTKKIKKISAPSKIDKILGRIFI
ncbi:hypothetical protein FACS189491_07740 [Spirochaetia bacterium]|nr:hypothetical protein FACS189491_07740 [Spirochaetia bacterium]